MEDKIKITSTQSHSHENSEGAIAKKDDAVDRNSSLKKAYSIILNLQKHEWKTLALREMATLADASEFAMTFLKNFTFLKKNEDIFIKDQNNLMHENPG